MGDKVDEFNDREDARAENKAFKTRPRPRKTLHLKKRETKAEAQLKIAVEALRWLSECGWGGEEREKADVALIKIEAMNEGREK